MAFWHGVAGITRCCNGLWRVLIVRASGRAALELERERNRATATTIQLLPPGAGLLESEPDGRLRVILMPEPASPPPAAFYDGSSRLAVSSVDEPGR